MFKTFAELNETQRNQVAARFLQVGSKWDEWMYELTSDGNVLCRKKIEQEEKQELNEPVLSDDYPMYVGYLYVVDGKVIESPQSGDVRQLKHVLKVSEIRRCDIVGREKLGLM